MMKFCSLKIPQDYKSCGAGSSMASFVDIEEALSIGDLSSAATLLSGISASNNVEENTVTYYTLYLAYATYNFEPNADVSESDLLALATLCPSTAGACVYQARSLHNTIFKEARDYPLCETTDVDARKAADQADDLQQSNWDVNIYPNPATNYIEIRNSTPDEILGIRIYDLGGRMVLKTTVKQKGFLTNLELNLINGAYLVYFRNGDDFLMVKKLIIAK